MGDKIRIWEPTDPAVKLFGKPIQLPEASLGPSTTADAAAGGDDDVAEHRSCGMDSGLEDESTDEKANGEDATSGTEENLGKPTQQSETTAFSSEGEKSDAGVPQEKILKKPDKIIPCPRCASMDTKFCYFNNYNVNQPRYFCRKCQRYWTSGGTLRKLPVGAGRRKSKIAAVDYPQIAVNGDFPSAAAPHSNGVVHHPVARKGSILSFVPDQHTHEISSTKVADKARQTSTANCSSNFLTGAGVVVDDNISGSAGSVSNIENEDECKAKAHTAQSYQVFQPQMMCFPAPLWPPYPWNPAQYNYPLPMPINFQPGFPMPFYPAPMYMAWNMPWSVHPSSPNLQPDPKPPTLGKHSRSDNVAKVSNVDENEQRKEESPKPSIWIPKTLHIDDLEEAAKSSMRVTLGIKNDNTVTAGSKGHSKPFSSQTDATSHGVITLSALLANPAALSRSMNFHEST